MLVAAILVVFPFCMAFAAVSDMLSMTIANRVSAVLVVAFAILAPLTGMDWASYGLHFAAGLIVLTVTFALFAIGGMGGGDAKLMSATALWMGLAVHLVQYLLVAAFVGGALTLLIVAYRGSPLSVFTGRNPFLRYFADEGEGIPYGIALGIAGLFVFPQTPMMAWALAHLAAT